jgi:hypothetical protein
LTYPKREKQKHIFEKQAQNVSEALELITDKFQRYQDIIITVCNIYDKSNKANSIASLLHESTDIHKELSPKSLYIFTIDDDELTQYGTELFVLVMDAGNFVTDNLPNYKVFEITDLENMYRTFQKFDKKFWEIKKKALIRLADLSKLYF